MSVDKGKDYIALNEKLAVRNEKQTEPLTSEHFNSIMDKHITCKDEYDNLLKKEVGSLSKEINLEYKN